MVTNRRLWGTLVLLTFTGLGTAEDPVKEPKKEVAPREEVPISSMRCVVGPAKDRVTCLAGAYRKNRAFSIYAPSIEEPNLNAIAKKVNGLLEGNKELRGYILLGGNASDDKLRETVQEWAKEQQFTKIDVAISLRPQTFGIDKGAGVTVVYSEQREIKFRRKIEAAKLEESALKELVGKLEELAR